MYYAARFWLGIDGGGLLTVSHHFVWSSQFKGCWRSVKFQESGYGYISYCYITTTGNAGGLPSNV